jgi:hypothetical protein
MSAALNRWRSSWGRVSGIGKGLACYAVKTGCVPRGAGALLPAGYFRALAEAGFGSKRVCCGRSRPTAPKKPPELRFLRVLHHHPYATCTDSASKLSPSVSQMVVLCSD